MRVEIHRTTLEQNAETRGVKGTCHVNRAVQFRRVVGVVGEYAHIIRTGNLLKSSVGKGGDGVGKGGGDLFACESP